MPVQQLLETIRESFTSSANVKTVFGEPVHTNGKTIIPAAKIAYGFGAGGGSRSKKETAGGDEGGGGGGGVRAYPAGAIEITDKGTRWVPASNWLFIGVIANAAFFTGLMMGGVAGAVRRWRR
jgi:uncharacterized spore protein YtfJ